MNETLELNNQKETLPKNQAKSLIINFLKNIQKNQSLSPFNKFLNKSIQIDLDEAVFNKVWEFYKLRNDEAIMTEDIKLLISDYIDE